MIKKIQLIILVMLITGCPLLAQQSKMEALSNRFVDVAKWLKVSKEDDQNCMLFLKFALKLHPRNRQGLLLQARLENPKLTNQIDSAVLSSDIKDFVKDLDALAEKQSNKIRKLLLYKYIAILDQANDNALIAVTHAENNKYDASIEELIKKF